MMTFSLQLELCWFLSQCILFILFGGERRGSEEQNRKTRDNSREAQNKTTELEEERERPGKKSLLERSFPAMQSELSQSVRQRGVYGINESLSLSLSLIGRCFSLIIVVIMISSLKDTLLVCSLDVQIS
jgi:hypothetical protein